MATSSYKSFLMHSSGSSYEKLADIKDYPDLGGSPELLETTTLSDKMQTYINGIQSADALQFTLNYDLEVYKKLKALENKDESYAVWFGGTDTGETVTPTGSEGKFNFKGSLSVAVTGASVNSVREMKISIAPSTPITLSSAE